MSPKFFLRELFFALIFGLAQVSFVYAQTTAFTYQGRFTDGGTAANGTYDMQFKLFDGSGNQVGSTLTNSAVQVSSGVFTVQLDYGAAVFSGADRFLEICVRPAGNADPYTILSPRQALTSAVYAIRAGSTTTADNAIQLGGVAANQYVQTNDSRLTDSRTPTPGSADYIQNGSSLQAASNFNISGNGTAGGALSANIVNATGQYNLGGQRLITAGPNNNTFAGFGAGAADLGAQTATFFGKNAGNHNTTGQGNTFVGAFAGSSNTTGLGNSFFGESAGANNTAAGNSFFGYNTGWGTTTGTSNSFFGFHAGTVNQTGSFNSFFGSEVGTNNNGANDNSFFGYLSGHYTKANNNSFFGSNSGAVNVNGAANSFFGKDSGLNNKDGNNNAFFGFNAGGDNLSGSYNAFFGANAGAANTTAINNAFFGQGAGFKNTEGHDNTFLGNGAGLNNFTANGNTFVGSLAGQGTLGGGNNTFVGLNAGTSNIGSSNNTFVGANSANGNLTGNGNTYLGANTNGATIITNATAIGANAFAGQSNSIILGSVNTVNGATADTKIGIGTTTPAEKLTIKTGVGNYGFIHTDGTVTVGSWVGSKNGTLGGWIGTQSAHPLHFFTGGGTAAMTLETSGFLRLNNVDSGGSLQFCLNASNHVSFCSSSLRYKTNIKPFIGGLSVLNRLRPITFDWKEGGMHDLGFGAEDIAAVEPLLVTHNNKGEVEGVKYDRISAVLVNAVKEQQEQIRRQQAEIETLKTLICRRNRRAPLCK